MNFSTELNFNWSNLKGGGVWKSVEGPQGGGVCGRYVKNCEGVLRRA